MIQTAVSRNESKIRKKYLMVTMAQRYKLNYQRAISTIVRLQSTYTRSKEYVPLIKYTFTVEIVLYFYR